MILCHPTLISTAVLTIAVLTFRYNFLFRSVIYALPLIVFAALSYFTSILGSSATNLNGSNESLIYTTEFINFKFITNINFFSLLIAYAITLIVFVANLYALKKKDKISKITSFFGSLYASFCYMALLAGDLISLIVSIELMMICSSILIYIGGKSDSIKNAKKYFITHFFSGSLITIGISWIVIQTGSYELSNFSHFILHQEEFSGNIAVYMMLLGLLINVAVFPFSGWMINSYSKASPLGFIYLICFTSKVSVLVLAKIFPGLMIVKYFATFTMLYSGYRALIENNLFRLLSILSIIQMSFMLLAISIGDESIIGVIILYLFIHMIYKFLLSIILAEVSDRTGLEYSKDIFKIKNSILKIGTLISLSVMISIPCSLGFFIKSYISYHTHDIFMSYFAIFLSAIILISLPIKAYYFSKKSVKIKLSLKSNLLIAFMTILLTTISFLSPLLLDNSLLKETGFFPLLNYFSFKNEISLISSGSIKQLFILIIGIFIALFINFPKTNSDSLNIIDEVRKWYLVVCRKLKRKSENNNRENDFILEALESYMIGKLKIIHNQQTSIFIVFVIFLLMFISFI